MAQYTTAPQSLTYDTPLFRAGGVSAAEIGGIMAQSAQAIPAGPEIMLASVPSITAGGVPVTASGMTEEDSPGFVTVPIGPVAIGAVVGYLLSKDTAGLLLGGLAGFLFKDKINLG